jgi:hypothetical protein
MTPIGCAFSHYVTVGGYRIGLPEVVEEETKRNFRKNIHEYKENIETDYRRLLAIFGKLKNLVVPTDAEIEEKIKSIFDNHSERVTKVPFDLDAARISFDKILSKEAPNSENNQQFKDGVIWANCLLLAKTGDVSLVTQDKAFYEQRKYENGLSANLLKEAQSSGLTISIYSSLADLISDIRCDVEVDENKLVDVIREETYENTKNLTDRKGFYLKEMVSKKFEFFATTDPLEVSVVFCLKYELEDYTPERRLNPYAESRGEFLFNLPIQTIRNFVNHGEYVIWQDSDGELQIFNSIYGYANSVFGHKTIEHKVRYKLSEVVPVSETA